MSLKTSSHIRTPTASRGSMELFHVSIVAYKIPYVPSCVAAHTRVLVDNREWFFCPNMEGPTWRPPGSCSLDKIGAFKLGLFAGTRKELYEVIAGVRADFGSDDYHRLTRNCNCFARDLCAALLRHDRVELSRSPEFPAWTNRLPRAIVGERDSLRDRVVDGDLSGVWGCVASHPESAHAALDIFGTTPLICAANHGRESVCEALCSIGCDTTARDIWGWSAIDYALYRGYHRVVAVMFRFKWSAIASLIQRHQTLPDSSPVSNYSGEIPFENDTKCNVNGCHLEFNLLERRHHCRKCGHSCCGMHSLGRWFDPQKQVMVRVCDSCMAVVARREEACVRVLRLLEDLARSSLVPGQIKQSEIQDEFQDDTINRADEWVELLITA